MVTAGNRFTAYQATRWWRCLAGVFLLTQVAAVHAEPPFVTEGEAGFVVSDIEFALSRDAKETGACPSGMTRNLREIFAMKERGKRREGESDAEYEERLEQGARELGTGPDGQNLCMHPEAGKPDPHFRAVQSSDIPVFGIDIDGENAANDFPGIDGGNGIPGLDGGSGIDNQFYRVVGCSRSYQSSGQSNEFATSMLTGAWGIVLKLSGVDDIRNDDEVQVGFYANADPIQVSPQRDPLSYATYAMDQDPRFRATATGRIEDGVLTTEPTDMRFRNVVNSLRLERPLKDARLKATLSEKGTLTGYLAGYTPVEAMYDLQYGYRDGKDGSGELAPLELRSGSASGAASVLGHTCHGAYYALHEHADGHPDPETGEYTSISTQYKIEAIPAFVVDTQTESTNAELDQEAEYGDEY